MKIAIAGASGFIGKRLVRTLLEQGYEVVALSRKEYLSEEKNLTWKKCDLFSLLDIERALEGVDIAIYLVHSMLPLAHLKQGSFCDFDLTLADNFGRGCKKMGVKRAIYLGGIVPDDTNLSDHLRSRLEVEKTLRGYLPVLSLRAGIIIGAEGSSFLMMVKLVRRLPFMFLPFWAQTLSSPIHVEDVLKWISFGIKKLEAKNKVIDIGGADCLSYKEMLTILAKKLKKKRLFLSFTLITPRTSRLWVTLVTGAPKSLVYPLVMSLKNHMAPDPLREVSPDFNVIGFEEALELELGKIKKEPFKIKVGLGKIGPVRKEVRSIQRLQTVFRSNAQKVAESYFEWLPKGFSPWVKVTRQENFIHFRIPFIKKEALTLEYAPQRSSELRQLFYIRGGFLAYPEGRGRLEFRSVLKQRYTIAAIHEFKPRLPWFVYKYTQALIHLWAMSRFNKYIVKQKL